MREVQSNIWKHKLDGEWIIIATNGIVGRDKRNDMTEDGVSIQVNFIYENFSKELGAAIKEKGNIPFSFEDYGIITFPVREGKKDKPSVDFISENIPKLIKLINKMKLEEVYMVQPGCCENGLNWKKEVRPVIKKLLDDRFIICVRKEKRKEKIRKQVAKAVEDRRADGLN